MMMCVNLVSLVCDELKFLLSLKRKPIKIKYTEKLRKRKLHPTVFFHGKIRNLGKYDTFRGRQAVIFLNLLGKG